MNKRDVVTLLVFFLMILSAYYVFALPSSITLNSPSNGAIAYSSNPTLNVSVSGNQAMNVTFWSKMTSISAGYDHTCGVLINGSVMCWGANDYGDIGDGTLTQRNNPVFVNASNTFVQTSLGQAHTCGLLVNGSVMCWGYNYYGGLGDGTSGTNRLNPVFVNTSNVFVQVAVGFSHSCGLLFNGSVKCWGGNYCGQIGDGTTTQRNNPVFVNTSNIFVQLASGSTHSCGLLVNGSVMCWGYNYYGQLGDGTSGTNRLNPVFVNASGKTFVQVSVGVYYTCGLLSNGSVMCWGYNYYGQIGDGTSGTNRLNPVFVNTSNVFVQVAVGDYHSCGLLSNGSVMCWGYNYFGGIGDGTSGTDRLNPVFVSSPKTFVQISAGDSHSCGLLVNGSAMCWGRNEFGYVGDGTTTQRNNPVFVNTANLFKNPIIGNVSGVSSGSSASVTWSNLLNNSNYLWGVSVVDSTATLLSNIWNFGVSIPPLSVTLNSPSNGATGVSSNPTLNVSVTGNQPINVTFWSKMTSISAGQRHSCGLLVNGSAMCWGNNDYSQIGDGTTGTNRLNPVFVNSSNVFVQIIGGSMHSCGLLVNGSAMCWGNNYYGQLGDGTNGTNRLNPVAVNTSKVFVQISVGYYHTCGLLVNGSAMCWGYNGQGAVGDGTLTQRNSPVLVNTSNTFVQVAVVGQHTCGLLTNGSVMCWGYNGNGQVGDGTLINRNTPVFVNTSKTFVQITAGSLHSCGLLVNGSVMCWGNNDNGQVGDGTSGTNRLNPMFVNTSNTFVQVAAGDYHNCGLLSNGSAMCWGYNVYGGIGDGTLTQRNNPVFVNTSNTFVQITGGDLHSCGVLANGSVKCWGYNYYGQIGDGTNGTNRLNPTSVNTSNLFNSAVPVIGNVSSVSSGSSASVTWSNLLNNSNYLWGVSVVDSTATLLSNIWNFGVGSAVVPVYSNLSVNDSAEGSSVFVNSSVDFFAYYVNATSGAAISSGVCNVTFDDGTGPFNMSYDAPNGRYNYTKSVGFTAAATHNWNVSCNASGFSALTANDTVLVNAINVANLTINDSAEGSSAFVGSSINFFAYYTNSSGSLVSGASCNVSFDDGSSGVMSQNSGYYNFTKSSGFSSAGTKVWNVSCAKSGYTTLTANDTVSVILNPANLSVNSSVENSYVYVSSPATFFAYYTNSSGSLVSGASCNVSFDDGSSGVMSQSSGYYNFTKSVGFNSAGTKVWNVSCAASGYTPLATNDTVVVNLNVANLTINDSAEGSSAIVNDVVTFYAYYKNTSGNLISGANCTIYVNGGSNLMTENTSHYYSFTSFSTAGNFDWNVTCTKSGFTSLNASDGVAVGFNTANLTINDSVGVSTNGVLPITFYAYYTNSDDDLVVGANCSVSFDDGTSYAMSAGDGYYYTNKSGLPVGLRSWNVSCTKSGYDILFANDFVTLTGLPLYSKFSGVTTNFSKVSDLSHTEVVLAIPGKGSVRWSSNNVTFRNFDAYVNINDSMVSVNSTGVGSVYDTSANISLENVDCFTYNRDFLNYRTGFYSSKNPLLGYRCPDNVCTNDICSDTTLSFTASDFSGYAYGTNANLTINDSVGGNTVAGNGIDFYAYYVDDSGLISSASCNITISDNPGTYYSMTPVGSSYYKYSKSSGFFSNGSYDWSINCSSSGYTALDVSDTMTIGPALPPNASKFNGSSSTTNWSGVANYLAVPNVALSIPGKGIIEWSGTKNTASKNFDAYVNINDSLVSVNSAALGSAYSAAANITMYNVDCDDYNRNFLSYRTGFYTSADSVIGYSCPGNVCSNVNCSGTTLTFSVTGFSSYAYGSNANLSVNNSVGDNIASMYSPVMFYAYYHDSNNDVIPGASCNINFGDGNSGTMNISGDHYQYNKTGGYDSVGTYYWTVTCTKSGYTTLSADDTVDVGSPSSSVPVVFASSRDISGSKCSLFQNSTVVVNHDAIITVSCPASGWLVKNLDVHGTLTHTQQYADGLFVNASGNVTVESDGRIDVNGKGCYGGSGGIRHMQYGTGVYYFDLAVGGTGPSGVNGACVAGGSGAGTSGGDYNNGGGAGYGGAGSGGGSTFGTSSGPFYLGAGGGGGGGHGDSDTLDQYAGGGGSGGGKVRLEVGETLNVNGSITADGDLGSYVRRIALTVGGGGSGGSIWIKASYVAVDGKVSADGGMSGMKICYSCGGGFIGSGGGGGRIRIDYANNDFPEYSKFSGSQTTDFPNINLWNVPNLTLHVPSKGKITWINTLNATELSDFSNNVSAKRDSISNSPGFDGTFVMQKFSTPNPVSGINYDAAVNIGRDNAGSFASVDTSELISGYNSSANISLEGVNCSAGFSLYYADGFFNSTAGVKSSGTLVASKANIGGNCTNVGGSAACTNLRCSNNVLSFIAPHFSGYALSSSSSLFINDSAEGSSAAANDPVDFFAYYTNLSGNYLSGASCNISFDDNWALSYPMDDNVTGDDNYNFTKSAGFASGGLHKWNVICAKVGYDTIPLNDTVNITGGIILDIVAFDENNGVSKIVGDAIMFYANVTNLSSGAPVTSASCIGDFGDGSSASMDYDSGIGLYKYNKTLGYFSAATYYWNATCSVTGFPDLVGYDTVVVTDSYVPSGGAAPEFSEWAMMLITVTVVGVILVRRKDY